MARVLKLTPSLATRIVGFIRAGSYVETAAAASGISKTTFYEWLKRAASGEQPFLSFAEQVEEAQAMAEMRDLALIGKAAERDWTAAAWRLERKFPDRYGTRARDELTQDKLRAETELTRERTRALVQWDEVLAAATPEERAAFYEVAERVRGRAKETK